MKAVLIILLTVCALCLYVAGLSGPSPTARPETAFISIKGHPQLQTLPSSMTSNWDTWTLEPNNELWRVDNQNDGEDGWVMPTSYDNLFLPSDLPLPQCRLALGIVVAQGIPRYIMPSMVLSLETPQRIWRNRGICSLPRAKAWIDVFGAFSPPLKSLKLTLFGRSAPDVRFLEDQDGTAAWNSLFQSTTEESYNIYNMHGYKEMPVVGIYESFKTTLTTQLIPQNPALGEGYHFVDVVFDDSLTMKLPRYRMKGYLSDFDDPKRLLEAEDPEMLNLEPCGELDVMVTEVAAGSESEFLPEVYRDLYDEGNIIMS
mmetsp:Transcript_11309/g.18979  ORF Transcript_11309/g.18979 Transcript_11309/m.18979 type:complete len:315 (+) Transcript_11309:31-975(+)